MTQQNDPKSWFNPHEAAASLTDYWATRALEAEAKLSEFVPQQRRCVTLRGRPAWGTGEVIAEAPGGDWVLVKWLSSDPERVMVWEMSREELEFEDTQLPLIGAN